MSNTPPFSPVGSFVPREEFAPRVVHSSAIASLTLSGAGGIRVTGVQQELIYYLNSLFARPSNFISTSPPNSSSNANIVPSPVQAQQQLPPPNGSSAPRQPPHHQTSTSTTGSSTGTAPPGPPIWRAGLLHSAMIPGQAGAWQYELAGSPWRCSPKEELASVRLSIALVQTLGRFGWSLGAGVNAGRKREDHHTFILTSPLSGPPSSPSVATQSFAISFLRPNVISVIDPPQNLTPTILAAIRAAALEAEGLAEEGWVKGTQRNPGGGSGGGGAYKFKLKGYTNWYSFGFPRSRYETNTPPLLAKLLSALDADGMKLAVSIQIRPVAQHRDLWIITSSSPVPTPSAFNPSSSNNLGLSRSGTATTVGSKTTTTPVLASSNGTHLKHASYQSQAGPHSRQSSTSSNKPPILLQHSKQLSSSSLNKRSSLLTKKPHPNAPPPLANTNAGAPPPSACVPPSASPRKQDFAVLPIQRELSYADSGVAGIGAGERATPMGGTFTNSPVETVPMRMEDGGSKFAEGRDSTVSMGETDGGEGAAPTDTVYLPVEWDGPVDPNRITEVTEPNSSARQTYATQKSWESVVEPAPGQLRAPRPETQFYTPGNDPDDSPEPQYLGVQQANLVPADRRRQGESLLKGED